MTEEQRTIIRTEYIKNEKSMDEIAIMVDMSYQAVRSFINRQIKNGELEKLKQPKKAKRTVLRKTADIPPGTKVKCNATIARSCIYGSSNTNHLCNYFACTGELRILKSPNPKECNCFVKISKEHPRLVGKGEVNE